MSIFKRLLANLDSNFERKTLFSVQQYLNAYFIFLIDAGYVQHSLNYSKGGYGGEWRAIFSSKTNAIHIFSDRDSVFIMIESLSSEEKVLFDLNALIFFSTKEKIFIGEFEQKVQKSQRLQMEKLASLLEEYLEVIQPYLGSEFPKYRDELIIAQKKYREIYWNTYIWKKQESKVWDWE